ncbi:MAG: PD-(D/E)XK motif protein [Alphaproteobacteria bacterium]|nr:PD-(D/E)XK motif protein [Alphaproteobacteria bacterium]
MAPQNNECEDLQSAWRALATKWNPDGWSTIPVLAVRAVKVLAGRYFPENREAILICFPSVHIPSEVELPQAQGFATKRVVIKDEQKPVCAVSLTRSEEGDPELFATIALDIIALIQQYHDAPEATLFRTFINRILAWQSFMLRGGSRLLSNDEETGLFGELVVLDAMLSDEVLFIDAADSWTGPLGALRDFTYRNTALEVKSTLSVSKFSAHIGSIDQLDTQRLEHLFLVGLCLTLDQSGMSLSEKALSVRDKIRKMSNGAVSTYETRLISAGLLERDYDRYMRRFSHASTRFYEVSERFPRLVRANTRREITGVQYQIDLDMIEQKGNSFDELFELIKGGENDPG